jgi:hypothetical protein
LLFEEVSPEEAAQLKADAALMVANSGGFGDIEDENDIFSAIIAIKENGDGFDFPCSQKCNNCISYKKGIGKIRFKYARIINFTTTCQNVS